MVINNCKHNGGFQLTPLPEGYTYICVRCMVFRMQFSPDIAGTIRFKCVRSYPMVEPEQPDWRDRIISYPNNVRVVETEINKGTDLFPEPFLRVSLRKE